MLSNSLLDIIDIYLLMIYLQLHMCNLQFVSSALFSLCFMYILFVLGPGTYLNVYESEWKIKSGRDFIKVTVSGRLSVACLFCS